MRRVPFCNQFLAVIFGLLFLVFLLPTIALAQATETSTPEAPTINSDTYPDEKAWYNVTTGHFSFSVPNDVTSVAIDVATSTEGEPLDTFSADTTDFYVNPDLLIDGIQYVRVQFKNEEGWGDIALRPLLIDTVPPQPFVIKVEAGHKPGDFPTIYFDTTDSLSGIDHYEVYVPHQQVIEVSPQAAENGYTFSELEDSIYIVRVIAYDKAGNERDNTLPVLVEASWHKPVPTIKESYPVLNWLLKDDVIIMFFVFVVFAQFMYIIYEKDKLRKEEEVLRKEAKEIQEQTAKIFTALRNEIYDQVQSISSKKKLSKKEKEAVDGLNQAMKVSEALIKKEVKDVRNLLK